MAARKKVKERQDHEILTGKTTIKKTAKEYVRELSHDLYEGALANYRPYIRSKENDESLELDGDGEDDWDYFADTEMRYILTKPGMKRPLYDGRPDQRNMFSLQQFMTRHGPIDGVRQFHSTELFQRIIHQRDVYLDHCKNSESFKAPIFLARGKGGDKGRDDTLWGHNFLTYKDTVDRRREKEQIARGSSSHQDGGGAYGNFSYAKRQVDYDRETMKVQENLRFQN